MDEKDQAACAALAKDLADFLDEHAADEDEAVVVNALLCAACAWAAGHGRTPAEVREVLHRVGDGLLLRTTTPQGGAH